MKRNSQDDKLDDLLGRWAEARSADPARLESLRRRIAAEVDNPGAHRPRRTVERPSRSAVIGTLALATAAALLITVGVSWFSQGPRVATSNTAPDEPARFAQLDGSTLDHHRRLSDELARVFEGQLAWVAETDGQVWIGTDAAIAAGTNQPRVTVRLVVARQTAGRWTRVWAADIVSHQEQVVRISQDARSPADLVVWTHLLPDGLVAVESRLDLRGADSVETRYSGVQRPGTPESLPVSAAAGEYQVFQTVVLMDDEVS